jgi:hypothetical protein
MRPLRAGAAFLAIAVLAGTAWAQTPDAHKAPAPAELQGAWRLASREVAGVQDKAEGLMFFAGNRMGFVTSTDRPDMDPALNQKPLEQLTSDEKDLFVQAYRGLTAAAGTYEIVNGEISFTLQVSRQPRLPTKPENRRSWIEGERLVQDFVNSRGQHAIYIWERAR